MPATPVAPSNKLSYEALPGIQPNSTGMRKKHMLIPGDSMLKQTTLFGVLYGTATTQR
jgi:hypothetical protein